MSDTCLKVTKLIISLVVTVLSILCIVWIAKVYKNADDEPSNREIYCKDENGNIILPADFYSSGDFCFDHYQSFLDKGVFEDLNIRMKKIRKFSLATIIVFSISFGLIFISLIMIIIGIIAECPKNYFLIIPILAILGFLASIVSFIFFIILSVHYFKSNFDDFDKFGDCEYLNPNFDKDYDFINVVKDNYLKYFIVYIIVFVLNNVDNVIERRLKKKD